MIVRIIVKYNRIEIGKLTYLEEKIITETMRVTEIILKLEDVDQMLMVPHNVHLKF
jgi:hypothetical protein